MADLLVQGEGFLPDDDAVPRRGRRIARIFPVRPALERNEVPRAKVLGGARVERHMVAGSPWGLDDGVVPAGQLVGEALARDAPVEGAGGFERRGLDRLPGRRRSGSATDRRGGRRASA